VVGIPEAEPFHGTGADAVAVRGFLHRPVSAPRAGLVLTHGAGSNCRAPLLVALAQAFAARALVVLRCDLPFRQARPTGPPHPSGAARDREGLKSALQALHGFQPGRLFLGGQSYGGRQASVLATEAPELVAALLLVSYPLHPPGRPRDLRTGHFPELRTPTFFAHGSTDPFGSVDELERARALIPAPTTLLAVDGAGHGLSRGGRASRPPADMVERVVDGFLSFAGEDGASRGG